jgi:hypothetical protein
MSAIAASREAVALDDLRDACAAVGLIADEAGPADRGVDLWLELDGQRLPVRVKTMSLADAGTVASSLAAPPARGLLVVVADRVVATAAAALSRPGYGFLDRRGRLVLRGPGLVVDAAVPATYERADGPVDALRSPVGREVAALLLVGAVEPSVRGFARELGRSPGAVSTALSALRREGLVDGAGGPAVPALFWALADRWPTRRVRLRRAPQPGELRATAALGLGLDPVEGAAGWAVTDTLAAAAYVAPVVVGSAYPPDFVVPSPHQVTRAQRVLGTAEGDDYGATVRVAPVPWMCTHRVDAADFADTEWPLAHPVFVALDLAADPGRGREVVEGWTPPEPWRRVW